MQKLTLLLLLFAMPFLIKAQSSLWSNDSTSKRILKTDCDEKVFTRAQQPPSLKISKAEYEDTLASILQSKNAFHKTGKFVLQFVVTTQSQIVDLTLGPGKIEEDSVLLDCIQNLANLWLPAFQNGHAVCAYVRLDMIIRNDKLSIKIMQ